MREHSHECRREHGDEQKRCAQHLFHPFSCFRDVLRVQPLAGVGAFGKRLCKVNHKMCATELQSCVAYFSAMASVDGLLPWMDADRETCPMVSPMS